MKRLGSLAAASCILLAVPSAFAQQNANPVTPEPPYGYYHPMWNQPWGWHTGMMIGPVMMLLTIVGVAALIVLLFRSFGHGAHPHWYHHAGHPYGRGALDILDERFARGEIDKAEFEEKRKLLGRQSADGRQ